MTDKIENCNEFLYSIIFSILQVTFPPIFSCKLNHLNEISFYSANRKN